MMSVNNNNVDIALAMGFSDHTVKTKLNDDSGAGVNAGSGLHIFAAPDPLSELVWTPGKGLSLKCADNSLAKKKPILLWNVAPSNEVSSPPEIIRFNGINDEKDIGEGSTNGMENINPAEVDGNVDTNQNKESQRENEEKDLSVLQTIGEGERDSIPPQESDKKVAVKEERSKRKMQISCHKRKGKGKALSDSDDSNGKMSSSEEGSHESVESCNSARIFPESKNLENSEQPLYLGSKRVKTQMQRNVAPTSPIGHGSSFFTWISNMVNGLSKPSQEEVPLLALTVAHSNLGHEGNHNIWSTFAIPEIRISKDDISAGESKDVLVDDKMIIDVSPTQCPWENDGSDEQILVSNDKIITSASANVEGVSTKSTSAENKALGSLECSNYEKSIHKLNPIPFPKFKSSEAMTCLFARRLEAFKHNIPFPNARNEATCKKAICLFCGKSGDGFCNCSEATESDAFLAKEEGTYNIIVNHIGRCKEKSGIVTDTNNLAQTRESISVERKARSSDVPENVASNPGENVLKGTGTGVLPLSTFGSKETASVPKGAFDAIRRLRLSRGDILKWLDSNAPLSHLDGFFLRLRMGKWEGALGGTGYYIARISGITGSQQEYSAKDAKKCISVSICGITCSVGSQYVSNHDFLEDELMAWWCKTSESGGQVPSEDELRLKVEQKMKLGF
ncbi:PREDICTED: uncharacterized protein LOC109175609 isoform X5 [Ipomoea nil]|uniref:uncharacterized protein LOC109175609 isoform X5 n=1 Tax=Ipomoea nil TaxID=35883 RepID=UPI000900997F|nr:PREDICTED: uncharacterized protein LOC109175609 isoform X5 [Ipomoea nil]